MYFPLIYIRTTKLVRQNMFDETGPWVYAVSQTYLSDNLGYYVTLYEPGHRYNTQVGN